MTTEYIFVYGSLRSEFTSPAQSVLRDYAEFIEKATLQGKLYRIDWYPGVVESDDPDEIVHGEVYKMTDQETVLSKLDQYEGCSPGDPIPHEFERQIKKIRLLNGEEILAWMYTFVLPESGKERILSGDYVKYLGGKM